MINPRSRRQHEIEKKKKRIRLLIEVTLTSIGIHKHEANINKFMVFGVNLFPVGVFLLVFHPPSKFQKNVTEDSK